MVFRSFLKEPYKGSLKVPGGVWGGLGLRVYLGLYEGFAIGYSMVFVS